jgi:hypothetical protein
VLNKKSKLGKPFREEHFMKTHLMILPLIAAAMFAAAPAAHAQCDGCNGGGWGWGYDMGGLYQSLDYNVPYFAAHPPVYYSYPVPRTYGYSPFAYPPYVMTPDVAGDSAPLEITNPYVPSSQHDKPQAQTDQSAIRQSGHVEPLVIMNPYVSTKGSVADLGN